MNVRTVCRRRFEAACASKWMHWRWLQLGNKIFLLLGNGLHKRKTTVVSFMFSADTARNCNWFWSAEKIILNLVCCVFPRHRSRYSVVQDKASTRGGGGMAPVCWLKELWFAVQEWLTKPALRQVQCTQKVCIIPVFRTLVYLWTCLQNVSFSFPLLVHRSFVRPSNIYFVCLLYLYSLNNILLAFQAFIF
jgi:hypothetical protein